jgi:ribosome biogenesis GTPase
MTALARLGWDAAWARAYARHDVPCQRPARVPRADRGVCTVLGADGAGRASTGGALLAAAARDPRELPCAGDWVVVRLWPDERTTVEAVLPRRTQVVRAAAGRRALAQVLAANIDVAAVVEPMDPTPDLGRIERLLAVAADSGARPLVVLTKADLVPDPDTVAAQVAESVAGVASAGGVVPAGGVVSAGGVVPAGGVAVVAVSAERGTGLAALVPATGATLGLLGASGAGKSTLVNALAGTRVMGTQGIRRADGRGRHTTTYRALIPLPGGGAVLDTPELRGVGLFGAGDGLDSTFADVEELAAACRFADCGHRDEPGCAVLAALSDGLLTPRRLESWRRLHRESTARRRRYDVRLAAEQKALWRRRTGDQRARRVGRSRGTSGEPG